MPEPTRVCVCVCVCAGWGFYILIILFSALHFPLRRACGPFLDNLFFFPSFTNVTVMAIGMWDRPGLLGLRPCCLLLSHPVTIPERSGQYPGLDGGALHPFATQQQPRCAR